MAEPAAHDGLDASATAACALPASAHAGVPGIDLVVVADIASSLHRFGDRYLERTFTPAELAAVPATDKVRRLEYLAGRFAAKEAILKAVRHPRSAAMSWLDIEVVSAEEGWPLVRLRGALESWSTARGVAGVEVSISHEGGIAMAVAMAHGCPHGDRCSWDAHRQHERLIVNEDNMKNEEQIRGVLAEHARLATPVEKLGVDDDLYNAGMTSHASVNVMLGLEDAFDVEFPDALLRRDTFQSIASIDAAVSSLVEE